MSACYHPHLSPDPSECDKAGQVPGTGRGKLVEAPDLLNLPLLLHQSGMWGVAAAHTTLWGQSAEGQKEEEVSWARGSQASGSFLALAEPCAAVCRAVRSWVRGYVVAPRRNAGWETFRNRYDRSRTDRLSAQAQAHSKSYYPKGQPP